MEILMKLPPHRNIVQLQYFSADPIGDEENARLLTLVMDYLPTTLQEVIQEYATGMPSSLVQIYAGQLLSALAHLSDRNIVHRDVLPRNILIDQRDKRLKLADFGCAKLITPNSVNHPHVGSWQYRAIELLFGATHYSTKAGTLTNLGVLFLDIWSASVIILEMVSGQYPFPETSEDRVLDKIYTVLGPVSVDQVRDMGLDPLDFPHLLAGSLFNARRWSDIEAFPKTQSNELRSLLNEGLEYSPRRRADAATLLNHQFFKTDYTSPNQ